MILWNNLTVKWKLTIVILVLTLIQMVSILLSVNNVLEKGFTQEHQRNGKSIVSLIDNLITIFEQDLQRSVTLLQQNESLLAATYFAGEIEDSEELQIIASSLLETLSVDILEIGNTDGTVLADAYASEETRDIVIDERTIQEALQGKQVFDIVSQEHEIVLRVVAPLKSEGELIGTVMAGIFIDDGFVQKITAAIGEEVAILKGSFPVASSNQAFKETCHHIISEEHSLDENTTNIFSHVKIEGLDYTILAAPFTDRQGSSIGTISVGLARTGLNSIQKQTKLAVIKIIVVLVLSTLVLVYVMSSLTVRPLVQMTEVAKAIAQGHTNEEIPRMSNQDEIGILARAFQSMITYFREMTQAATRIASGDLRQDITPRSDQDTLGQAFQHMSAYLSEIASVATAIAEGDLTAEVSLHSETDAFRQVMQMMTTGLHSLIRQIRTSAEQISSTGKTITSLTDQNVEIVQRVQTSTEDMISTMTAMGVSVEEVDQNMNVLSASVEETSSSVSEMTVSITEIASNTTNLAQKTQETITMIEHSVQTLGDVTEKTDVSRQLSQETMQDALEGQQAFEQVRVSMDTIQQTNLNAVETMNRFAEESRDIDTILDVIHDITEQSSLLALNASIIAAQAGTQGRGFAVIADEMRTLATQVATSAKDIGAIVKSVQHETKAVVQMIHDGTVKIDQGVQRTQQAEQRLQKILSSAQRSSTVITEIADTLYAQMTTNRDVMGAIARVSSMTTEITRATEEQKASVIQIHDAIEHILNMASQTQQVTVRQLKGVQQVIKAGNTASTFMDQNLESSQHINRATTADLAPQAKILLQSVDRFRLK